MAASSGDDIPTQLAALLGRETVQIRRTDETHPRVSVIDTIAAVTGRNANRSAEAIRDIGDRYPEVNGNIVNLKFPATASFGGRATAGYGELDTAGYGQLRRASYGGLRRATAGELRRATAGYGELRRATAGELRRATASYVDSVDGSQPKMS